MRFLDAGAAIIWSEEQASRPDIGSQIGKLMRGLGGNGEVVFDIALSISAKVAACEPPEAAAAAKAIYGGYSPERDSQVGYLLGQRIKHLPAAKKRPAAQIQALGTATLMAERALVIYRDKYPLRRMAYDCGVSDSAFRKSLEWVELRSEATTILRGWIKVVEYQIELYLIETDMLAGEVEA